MEKALNIIHLIASEISDQHIFLSDIADVLADGEALRHLGISDDDQTAVECASALVLELIQSGKKYWND